MGLIFLTPFTTPYPILDLGSGLKPPQNNMLALVTDDGACCTKNRTNETSSIFFVHMVTSTSCSDHGAPAHLLLLHEQLKEDGLVPLVLDAARISGA